MSDFVKEYDKTLEPGDTFEFVKSIFLPGGIPIGTRGVIRERHNYPEAVYYDFLDGAPPDYRWAHDASARAAYMCCMRRVDDATSFIPEDWS